MSDVASPIDRLRKLQTMLGARQTISFSHQWLSKREVISFKLPGMESTVYCRRESSDVHVLWQVFGIRQYAFQLPFIPATIVDAGANVGYASLFFAMVYPQAQILAVEPESNNCRIAKRNCLAFPQVTIIESALWPSNEALQFTSDHAESWSYQVEPFDGYGQQMKAITPTTMSQIISYFPQNEIDLLKLDIEGAERALFETEPERWLDNVKSLSVECHDQIYPGTTDHILDVMHQCGFYLELRTEELLLFVR